jgi:hypothetical protein
VSEYDADWRQQLTRDLAQLGRRATLAEARAAQAEAALAELEARLGAQIRQAAERLAAEQEATAGPWPTT